jgi:hypothetical protein
MISVKSFEIGAEFRYFGTIILNQNYNDEQIFRRLNSGNAYYHSVQNSFIFVLKLKVKLFLCPWRPIGL